MLACGSWAFRQQPGAALCRRNHLWAPSTQAGMLVDLVVDDYQTVTQKQVLGRIQVQSADAAAAEIAAMKADLEVMRVRMNQDQSRNDLSYQQARVDLQLRRLELASAGIRLQQKFYEKINWRMEPISWEHEIRATRFMGQLLIALACAFAAAWIIKIVKF